MFWPQASLASSGFLVGMHVQGLSGCGTLAHPHSVLSQALNGTEPSCNWSPILHTLVMLSERMLKAGPIMLVRLEGNQYN